MKSVDILQKNSLFGCLNENELTAFADASIIKNFPKNTILFSEGDRTDSIYIVCSGKVKVTIIDPQGKEIILSLLGPGEYFGEMAALVEGETRSACVMTREASQLLILSKDIFKKILSTHSDIVFKLLRESLERLKEANKKIESLALMDVYGRVARLLTHLAVSKDNSLIIGEKLTHQEIANMVGSSREMVSRVIKELVDGGYLSVTHKIIQINRKLPYSW